MTVIISLLLVLIFLAITWVGSLISTLVEAYVAKHVETIKAGN